MSDNMTAAYDGVKMVSPIISTACKLIEQLAERGVPFESRAFRISKMPPEALKFQLDAERIRYQELKTKNTILVDKDDIAKVVELESREATNGCFLQEYDQKELEKLIVGHPAVPNKAMIHIDNVTPVEMKLFLKKCNRIKTGLLLKTYKSSNGTYSISIPEGLLSAKEKSLVVKAYIQSVVGASGVNRSVKNGFSKDMSLAAYKNAVQEYRLSKSMSSMIEEVINKNNISALGQQLAIAKKNAALLLESLNTGEKLPGFNENQYQKFKDAASNLPEGTYEYAPTFIKKHTVTSVTALTLFQEEKEHSHSMSHEVND